MKVWIGSWKTSTWMWGVGAYLRPDIVVTLVEREQWLWPSMGVSC